MVSLYWGIGKRLAEEITGVSKPEYGNKWFLKLAKGYLLKDIKK